MENTNPKWYCPQCTTEHTDRKKYCSNCTTNVMLRFKCPVTGVDGLYSNFTSLHIPNCRTCKQYHHSSDVSIANTRRQRTAVLADTTKGILRTLSLLIVCGYCTMRCYCNISYAIVCVYRAVL